MATTEVIYKGELSTENIHLKSSSVVITDAPTDNNGLGRTFSPTDLLSTSLASCMLTIMGIFANERQLDITGTKAVVTKIMGTNPRCVVEIIVKILVPDRNLSESNRTALEKAAVSCPVALSLNKNLKQTVTFSYTKLK